MPPAKVARTQDPAASLSNKANLNTFCSKVMRRVMDKGEVAYETVQVVGGFQATVRCAGLPGPAAEMVWAGEVCSKKVDAEQSAAGIAYETLQGDAELVAAFGAPPKPKTTNNNWMGGKGKGKGFKGKGKFGGMQNHF